MNRTELRATVKVTLNGKLAYLPDPTGPQVMIGGELFMGDELKDLLDTLTRIVHGDPSCLPS